MALNLQTMINNNLLNEIAKVLGNSTDADLILTSIGFPQYLRPRFENMQNPLSFWLNICHQIEDGTEPGNFESLLKAAANRFPGNQAFIPFKQNRPTYVEAVDDYYDIFLSYCSKDYETVKEFAQLLVKRGIKPWFDAWSLPLGKPFTNEIEKILSKVKCVVVFLGQNGYGPWQQLEVNMAIDRNVKGECNVIPVMISGTSSNDLPPILKTLNGIKVLNVSSMNDAVERIEKCVNKI